MKPKGKTRKTNWDTPANRIKKQEAFRLYAAGRPNSQIKKALGTNYAPTLEKFINSENWEKYRLIWESSPEKENPYPWEKENPSKLVMPTPKMEEMDTGKRLKCIKAFSMYCSGQNIKEIAVESGVSYSTVVMWRDSQRWATCRERLVNEKSPAPWEDDGVPTLISDITASLEAMKKSIKFLTGSVLVKAADAAQELDGMEALGMMRNIKQLAEAATINFSDGVGVNSAVQINIAAKLDSVEIPKNNNYEAELIVNE